MSFWHRIAHPFIWFTPEDLPRLRHNAGLPFWRPKFDRWREELAGIDRIEINDTRIDFHAGTNTPALKAALCFVVDGDPRYGRLVGGFLSAIVAFWRRSPDWRDRMCSGRPGEWTGNQWGGLSGNHIIDPQLWVSCAHLYDVIYGRGFLSPEDASAFEEMMALFHQVGCLHEENLKLDNNRSMWLACGSYVSALFDADERRARLALDRHRGNMPRFIETILPDGSHYEIGPYGPASIAVLQLFARCIRGAEGVDFFRTKVAGVGLEDAYRAYVGTLLPGGSLRLPLLKDRVNHWDSLCSGYAEYGVPELGWAISRFHERDWVPMFRHWPQGMEFYVYREPPPDAAPPARLDSHFPAAGFAILRSSWQADATSVYFRYGFQGSSHGGGLDKLNFELTCNDEPLISDSLRSERSHYKNVVLVDGFDQEQCSGRLLYSRFGADQPLRYVSALGGQGEWPDRDFLHDPRSEVNFWATKADECFPGVARVRRTVVMAAPDLVILRDTLWSLDAKEHDYQWLFQSFADPVGLGKSLGAAETVFATRRIHRADPAAPERRLVDRFVWPAPGLELRSAKATLGLSFAAHGGTLPNEIGRSTITGRYAYDGSSETGDGYSEKPMNVLHLAVRGRDVSLLTVLTTRPGVTAANETASASRIEELNCVDTDRGSAVIVTGNLRRLLRFDETVGEWSLE